MLCVIHVLLSETTNSVEGTENVSIKSLWRVDVNFEVLSIESVVGRLCTSRLHYHSF